MEAGVVSTPAVSVDGKLVIAALCLI
ncbi:hypothetical protein [Psychromonas sp.]